MPEIWSSSKIWIILRWQKGYWESICLTLALDSSELSLSMCAGNEESFLAALIEGELLKSVQNLVRLQTKTWALEYIIVLAVDTPQIEMLLVVKSLETEAMPQLVRQGLAERKLPVQPIYRGLRSLSLGKWRNPVRKKLGSPVSDYWKPPLNRRLQRGRMSQPVSRGCWRLSMTQSSPGVSSGVKTTPSSFRRVSVAKHRAIASVKIIS